MKSYLDWRLVFKSVTGALSSFGVFYSAWIVISRLSANTDMLVEGFTGTLGTNIPNWTKFLQEIYLIVMSVINGLTILQTVLLADFLNPIALLFQITSWFALLISFGCYLSLILVPIGLQNQWATTTANTYLSQDNIFSFVGNVLSLLSYSIFTVAFIDPLPAAYL